MLLKQEKNRLIILSQCGNRGNNMKFPYTKTFVIIGDEGDRKAVVTFTENKEKIAIDVRWKGRMPKNYENYDKICETKILKFLEDNSIDIGNVLSQDFGNDSVASRKAIEDYLK